MIDELNGAVEGYWIKWQTMIEAQQNKAFFEELRPTAVGWKTADVAEFDRCFAAIRDHADQIHIAWLNERWLAVLHLRDTTLAQGIQMVKIMQRRPGSDDALGLDHLDFYSPAVQDADKILGAEPQLKWTREENGLCKWISLWFVGTEAKLRTGTTFDVCITELTQVNNHILQR